METSVDPKKYDKEYFSTVLNSTDYTKPVDLRSFNHIYRSVGDLVSLRPDDHVVDFGCGSGHLSFYLYLKYHCAVTGIDYSIDAIYAAEENLELLSRQQGSVVKENIHFVRAINEQLPQLTDIRVVFLADVVEHLYDHELNVIYQTFQKWNAAGELRLVIHTDNNNFLIWIRPWIDVLAILFRKATIKSVRARNAWERKRHINLTTPKKLARRLQECGFVVENVAYTEVTNEKLRLQLGGLGKLPLLLSIVGVGARALSFLRPSFYLIAKVRRQQTL